MMPATEEMAPWTGGQTMQKPAPMIQEMMIMIRNGKRTPENIERAMGNCLFEYLLNTAPVMQPRIMPPNTPVSST